MPPLNRAARSLAAGSILALGASAAVAAGETEAYHTLWRACLGRAFAGQTLLTGRDLAADAALRACRGAEGAYVAALATSPLLDEADVARARPSLAARARTRLLESTTPEPRTASR